jgi:NAD-dependent protein deacetylase/lipoamidase
VIRSPSASRKSVFYDATVTGNPNDATETAVETARCLVESASRIVVLTGAGISTDSGIPDFRGPNGIWTKNPGAERTATIDNYVNDPEARKQSWARLAEGSMWGDTDPNAGHHALVALQVRGALHTLITQNVDELHQKAGIDPERVVEIHGTTRKVACLSCHSRDDIAEALERVRAGEDDPTCESCGGILKTATISFGQSLVAEDLARSESAARACDLMMAVGTSLAVYPIANVVPMAASMGTPVVIVNAEPTDLDSLAAVVVNAGISDVLPTICGADGVGVDSELTRT